MSLRTLETLDRLLEQGGEPDDVLRSVVRTLAEEPGVEWAGIAFIEEGQLVLGPEAGEQDEARRRRVPIAFQDARVGELWADGDADQGFLERVALLISAHVLIGWDTRGQAWEP
jgi:hypothetical protein